VAYPEGFTDALGLVGGKWPMSAGNRLAKFVLAANTLVAGAVIADAGGKACPREFRNWQFLASHVKSLVRA
jgi:hypothetical protein